LTEFSAFAAKEILKFVLLVFFAALRDLDSAGLDVIIARQFRELGLGVALNDRLRRGAAGGEK